MGYLVKASFNAEPRAYALEGIRTDVEARLLPVTALVRHEKQCFWYSVEELIGKGSTPSFRYLCEHCQNWLVARKIDVGLQIKCDKCSKMSDIPDIEIRKLAVLNHDAAKHARTEMIAGALIALIGILSSVASYISAEQPGGRAYAIFTGLFVLGFGTFHHGWSRSSQIRRKTSNDKK